MCRRVAARTNLMIYVAWEEQQQLAEMNADFMLGGMCFRRAALSEHGKLHRPRLRMVPCHSTTHLGIVYVSYR